MSFPCNCTQCQHAGSCRSYYGGSLCKYTKEINAEAIKRFWEQSNKKE